MAIIVLYAGFHPTVALDGLKNVMKKEGVENIYILYDNKRDRYGAVSRRNAKVLSSSLAFFDVKIIGVNPLSQESVFKNLYAVLKHEAVDKKKKIYIDITDMPPEAVATTTLVSLLFPSVNIYVVPIREKGEFIPPPESPKFEEWAQSKDNKRGLEPLELTFPNVTLRILNEGEEEFASSLLLTLYEHGGVANSIKQIIKWMGENSSDTVVKNRYARLINSLSIKGLLEKLHNGRNRKIRLTEFGSIFVESLYKVNTLKSEIKSLARPVTIA